MKKFLLADTTAILNLLEKSLFGIVVVGIILLTIGQFFLIGGPPLEKIETIFMQGMMTWQSEHQEAKAVSEFNTGPLAMITLETMDYSSLRKAKVFINGRQVADFRDTQVVLRVNPGDEITIDGSYYEKPFSVRVVKNTEIVRNPAAGRVFEIDGSMNIGPVVFE